MGCQSAAAEVPVHLTKHGGSGRKSDGENMQAAHTKSWAPSRACSGRLQPSCHGTASLPYHHLNRVSNRLTSKSICPLILATIGL